MAKQAKGVVIDEEMGLPDEKVPLISRSPEDQPEQDVALPDLGGSDIVQFSAPLYFVDEDEGSLKVDIIRLGSMKGRIAAKFATTPGSARSGEQYENVSGQVVFEDGEHTKSIAIPILQDGEWSPTVEFRISLTDPQNGKLGLYLNECRVKIIDDAKFPSDEYADDIARGEKAINEIDDWGLFGEYCKLNFDKAGIRTQTVFVMIFDQLKNFIIFGNLWVGVYIVDTLFVRGGPSSSKLIVPSRYHTALLIGLWFVVPLVVLHAWETFKIFIDIKGSSRAFLQKSMFRTYMDFTPASRQRVTPAELDMAIDDGAEECAEAYVAALKIVSIIGKIVTVALFVVVYQPEAFAVYSAFILPTVLVIFSAFRAGVAEDAQKRADDSMLVLAALTNEAHQKFRLIADYLKRPMISDMFARAVDANSEERVPVAMVELNTEFITKILSGLVICVYISLKTPDVLDGKVSLGIFLATIQIFGSHLAECVIDLNEQLMIIIKAFVAVKEFTTFLNLPLELPHLKAVNRCRRKETEIKRAELLQSSSGESFKSDLIPIAVNNLSFSYDDAGVDDCVFNNVNISVPQGHMTAVVGPHNSGKSTFFQLLSNIILPTNGNIYIPSHLRVLHVSREPMFLRASLLQNLTLGLPGHMIDLERIKNILGILGLSDMIEIFERDVCERQHTEKADGSTSARGYHVSEFSDSGWDRSLNHSRRVKLHIARALVANPEVLVLQRALQAFDEEVASDLLNVLRKHVKERGLSLPEGGRTSRRPRNVFFCTESVSQATQADTIWQMQPETKTIVSTTPELFLTAQTPRTSAPLSGPAGSAHGCRKASPESA